MRSASAQVQEAYAFLVTVKTVTRGVGMHLHGFKGRWKKNELTLVHPPSPSP
jgi:hypothetical protein